MTIASPIRLWSDFLGVLPSVVGIGGGTAVIPAVGMTVELFDGEGNVCEGTVEAVFDLDGTTLVHTRLIPDRWRTIPQVEDMANPGVRFRSR